MRLSTYSRIRNQQLLKQLYRTNVVLCYQKLLLALKFKIT